MVGGVVGAAGAPVSIWTKKMGWAARSGDGQDGLDEHLAALDLCALDLLRRGQRDMRGPGPDGGVVGVQAQGGFKGGQRGLGARVEGRAACQMRGVAARAVAGDGAGGALADLAHYRADRVGDTGMGGQDHAGAKCRTHRRVIGGCGGPEPDHRHPDPGCHLDDAAVMGKARAGQRMMGKATRIGAPEAGILGEGGLKQRVPGLRGHLVDDEPGETFRVRGAVQAVSGALAVHQGDALARGAGIPGAREPQDMRRIGRRHARQHHQAACDQPVERGDLQP